MKTLTKFQLKALLALTIACLLTVSSTATQTAPLVQTVQRLRQIKTEPDGGVPPSVILLLTRLKHQLRDLISGTLNAPENRGQTPQHLQAGVLSKLKRSRLVVNELEDIVVDEKYVEPPYVYGDIFHIEIRQPAGYPDLLVATTTLGVCCGEDTSLYIFKKDGTQWKLVLAQETNGYKEVSGAQGRFKYSISPPDGNHDFFIVTANVNPWCTSNWQAIRYKVLRVGPSAYQPKIILSQRDTIYLGIDEPVYKLSIKANTFTLSFINGTNNDTGNPTRKQVKYAVDGNRIKRVSSLTRPVDD